MRGHTENYVNKYQGTVTLFISGVLVAKKSFKRREDRMDIMREWHSALMPMYRQFGNLIYFEISHYQVKHRSGIKEQAPLSENAIKLKRRLCKGKTTEPEIKTSFERPKAEYSNKSFHLCH